MTDTAPTDADDATPTEAVTPPTEDETPSRRGDLTAIVVEGDARPDECTLYPSGASDETLVTEWMTAEEGSYVSLDEMR